MLVPRSFSPDGRSEVCFVEDPELRYVIQRYREIHDYMHALTGLGRSVLDELTLKWFEMVQTELPLCSLASFVGPLRLPPSEQLRLIKTGIPWAAAYGASSRFVMNVYFEKHFERDVEDLRQELRLVKCPTI